MPQAAKVMMGKREEGIGRWGEESEERGGGREIAQAAKAAQSAGARQQEGK